MKKNGQAGYTLIEVMVSIGLSMFVAIALGGTITTSVKLWNAHLEKATLQRNTTMTADWIRRDVQDAHSLSMISGGFRTHDRAGVLMHEYKVETTADGPRFTRDSRAVVPDDVDSYLITTNSDTTNVLVHLTLADVNGARMDAYVKAAVRDRTRWF